MKKKQGGSAGLIIGILLVVGIGAAIAITQDWKSGHNRLIDYAQARFGGPEAQYAMGKQLQESGRKDGSIRAQQWYQWAADKGHVPAMIALGDLFNLQDDQESGDEAVAWYQKAAATGNAEAIRKLGVCYETGRGKLKPDALKAFELYGQAARKGDVEAEYLYGARLYQRAQYDDAIVWLNAAADHGNSDADVELGKLYSDFWMPEDPIKAFTHFKRAAEAGNTKPLLTLAYMYFNGIGTPADPVEAYKWVLLANNTPTANTKTALRQIAVRLTPEQKAEGEARAKAFRAMKKKG